METVVVEGTPLAAFLEGEGTYEHSLDLIDDTSSHDSPSSHSFAPSANVGLRSRFKNRLPSDLNLVIPKTSKLSEAHIAWSKAINSRIGRSENAHFIEHFRYILIASQLLNEYQDHGSSALRASTPDVGPQTATHTQDSPLDITGLCVTVGVAFLWVCMIRWCRNGSQRKSRILITLVVLGLVTVLAYAYLRRQWLQYVRNQAVESASGMVTNVKTFEVASGAAMTLIQEVELVSKGYRISAPLPPVSRLDDSKASRRCTVLRRQLYRVYAAMVPALTNGIETLKTSMNENDYDKFLDVYDIPRDVIQEAITADTPIHSDNESLAALRMLSYRYSTLRRVFLCSLLSLEADGGAPDFVRWRMASEVMTSASVKAATHAKELAETLKDLEEFATPTTPKTASKSGNGRIRAQVRKISTLSQGIRSLQAKMTLLREESNKAIEHSDDLTDLGPSLMSQYESIGADLKSLMQDWETGKAALASNIGKQERRISLASSGFRSPNPSLGGLTAVDEDNGTLGGGPADALRALLGEKECSSNRSSLAATNSDEEVFEAIALPRVRERSTLTREERIAKMNEERARQADMRDKRMSNTNMIRELQSVINLRKPARNSTGRITSI